MKKPISIQIAIPEPCTQDWNDFQLVQGGRHCAHCQTTVVDFSRMTDAQLLAYFQKSGAAACGRFSAEQLDRAIKAVEVPRSTWWAKVAAGLLLSLGISEAAKGQGKREISTIESPASKTIKTEKSKTNDASNTAGFSEIYGTLKDAKGNPIVNANVDVSMKGVIKGRDLTDFDGNYKIKPLESGCYDIKFSYLGNDSTYRNIVTVAGEAKRADAKLVTGAHSPNMRLIMGRMVAPLINPENNK